MCLFSDQTFSAHGLNLIHCWMWEHDCMSKYIVKYKMLAVGFLVRVPPQSVLSN